MALTTCKECKAQISATAQACPQCGAKPKKTSGCAIVILVVIGFGVLSMMAKGCSDQVDTPSAPSQAPTATPAAPAVQLDPAAKLTEAVQTVDGVEARLKENAQKLKKYYGTKSQLEDSTADLLKLGLVRAQYEKSKVKAERALAARADALFTKVGQQQRTIYASTIEENFIKNGLDIRTSVEGSKKDHLRLKYVLMSKPLVYKFQNEMKLDEQAKVFGFTKLIYSDGYNESWTVDL
ncbi:hypothetical protein [Lysobacter enzymogenes]|uniref:hypothetical protein n=1 Tax=Lysobacter enzymogenes TaxID=69 RepID=UPI001AF2EC19|nr:hypothetical protein [Lysobacter enzymogenes]QQQ01012.1 hypothetical protein JHW41_23580 [Lysobacter enzymogenes]